MAINIIEICVKNQPGALLEVTDLLEKAGIDIYCISNSGEDEYIPVELILSHTEKAVHELAKLEYEIDVEEAIAVQVPKHPGGLNTVLRPLATEEINIIAIQSAASKKNPDSIVILRVNDTDKAERILKQNWINILDVDDF
ncbi:MAG: hypothetical protein ACRCUT_08500 [Spirochaetota bacterium]